MRGNYLSYFNFKTGEDAEEFYFERKGSIVREFRKINRLKPLSPLSSHSRRSKTRVSTGIINSRRSPPPKNWYICVHIFSSKDESNSNPFLIVIPAHKIEYFELNSSSWMQKLSVNTINTVIVKTISLLLEKLNGTSLTRHVISDEEKELRRSFR